MMICNQSNFIRKKVLDRLKMTIDREPFYVIQPHKMYCPILYSQIFGFKLGVEIAYEADCVRK